MIETIVVVAFVLSVLGGALLCEWLGGHEPQDPHM